MVVLPLSPLGQVYFSAYFIALNFLIRLRRGDAGRSRLLFRLCHKPSKRLLGVFVEIAQPDCALAVGVAVLDFSRVLCTANFYGKLQVGDSVRLR